MISLKYFKPQFMSLNRPHPMISYAKTTYQVNKCITTLRMLSGRFRCGSLLRHCYQHVSGLCELCELELEDLPHILLPRCPHLKERALFLTNYLYDTLASSLTASTIAEKILNCEDDQRKMQFFLDPRSSPKLLQPRKKNQI